MIKVEFTRNKDAFSSVLLTGHAEYAEYGSDIVCAAVSSQVISVENSLQSLLKVKVNTKVNESEGGYLKVTLPSLEDPVQQAQAQLLMQHLHLALSIIAEQYPDFVSVKDLS